MECIYSEFCCACLSRERKMKLLIDHSSNEEFHKIFTEISINHQQMCSLRICWECEARIFNFIKFKQQMTRSWKSLQEFVKEPLKSHPKPLSNLTTYNLEMFDSNQSQSVEENNYIKVTEPESPFDLEVKVEMDILSDDDRTLLDIITEKNSKEKPVDKQKIKFTEEQNDKSIIEHQENVFDQFLKQTKTLLRKESDFLQKKDEIFKKVDQILDKDKEVLCKKDKLLRKELKRLRREDRKVKKRTAEKTDDVFTGFEKIDLTYEEIKKDRSDLKNKQEYANSMFRCEHCIIPFANEEDYKEHGQKKHSLITKHKCAICVRCFPNAATLDRHLRRHTARWRCSLCAHLSCSAVAALAHYTRVHAQPTGEIHELAAKAYRNYEENTQENGEARPKSTAQIPCEHCPKTFRWRTSLRKHMETHNIESGQKRKPHCEPCNMTFTTTSNLKKHMQCSSKHQIQLKLRKLNQDPQDTSEPSNAPDIENIKSAINSEKEQFPCPQCDKKFQWKGNLWRHLQSHAARANGALVCEPCNRSFSSIATYKQHMEISRKHVTENEYKYMCSECGARFYNKIKLRDHIDWEHLKRYTHVCSLCQKVFKSHTSLYLHRQVVHRVNNASHLCDHCGKSFPNKTKLRSHVSALHTKDSPYKCTSCSARFSWHSCLSRHMRRVHKLRNIKETIVNIGNTT